MSDEPENNTRFGHPVFAVLTEIGIIAQLARGLLEERAPVGLNMPMFGVLNHLSRTSDQPTPLMLARAFQQPKTSMTHTLATLEKRGFVVMRPNPDDGRSKLVHLTDAGSAARDQVIATLSQDYAGLGEAVDMERIASILPVLADIRQYFDKNRP